MRLWLRIRIARRFLKRRAHQLIAFRPAHHSTVVKALKPFVPPPQTRVSWTVRPATKPQTIADWKRLHDKERAS